MYAVIFWLCNLQIFNLTNLCFLSDVREFIVTPQSLYLTNGISALICKRLPLLNEVHKKITTPHPLHAVYIAPFFVFCNSSPHTEAYIHKLCNCHLNFSCSSIKEGNLDPLRMISCHHQCMWCILPCWCAAIHCENKWLEATQSFQWKQMQLRLPNP